MFCDKVQFRVIAGKGGDGRTSFLHEKFREKGGPDGGDGGNGGSIFLIGKENLNTLYDYKTKREIRAKSGEGGKNNRKKGAAGEDLYLSVPLGTQIFDDQTGVQIADITEAEQSVRVARGGEGGFGNAHFISSVRQSPKVSEVGEAGEERTIYLEMKLIADVGLVGKPNVGKSTFLSVLTAARPKIADYPFTTLIPNLGVVEGERFGLTKVGFVIADIPGLIKGAATGKGLGDKFLRHVERTKILIHLIDGMTQDPVSDFEEINKELKLFSQKLTQKRQLIVLSKADISQGIEVAKKKLTAYFESKKTKNLINPEPIIISSPTHSGVRELIALVAQELRHYEEITVREEQKEFRTFTLEDVVVDSYSVTREGDNFILKGKKIERFARKTDFNRKEGRDRFFDIARRMGIVKELERQGAKSGDLLKIGEKITEI
ncbi:MAG: GTPase ObgE [Bacteriovoracaceae bacterium]